jgi:uncharacterized SAM-binding protein YcdF (DUF218 family)
MLDGETALFLTKVLPLAIYPLGATIGFGLIAVGLAFGGYSRGALVVALSALSLLWIASMPCVAVWAIASLENQNPPRPIAETPKADVAILLGGGVASPTPPRISAELNEAGDRVLHAARLFKAGKVQRILVTGGNIPWVSGGAPEADLMRDYLVEFGVPIDLIEIAGQSQNTYQNAREIVAMWAGGQFRSALLVTSAAHMPRAMAVFRKAGFPVEPSPTDVRAVPPNEPTLLDWLPHAGALEQTTQAIREWIGLFVYRLLEKA